MCANTPGAAHWSHRKSISGSDVRRLVASRLDRVGGPYPGPVYGELRCGGTRQRRTTRRSPQMARPSLSNLSSSKLCEPGFKKSGFEKRFLALFVNLQVVGCMDPVCESHPHPSDGSRCHDAPAARRFRKQIPCWGAAHAGQPSPTAVVAAADSPQPAPSPYDRTPLLICHAPFTARLPLWAKAWRRTTELRMHNIHRHLPYASAHAGTNGMILPCRARPMAGNGPLLGS